MTDAQKRRLRILELVAVSVLLLFTYIWTFYGIAYGLFLLFSGIAIILFTQYARRLIEETDTPDFRRSMVLAIIVSLGLSLVSLVALLLVALLEVYLGY